MNADFLAVLEYWEKEKGISREILTTAVEEALLSAAKKAVGPARELRVAIEPDRISDALAERIRQARRIRKSHFQARPDHGFRRSPHQSGRPDR